MKIHFEGTILAVKARIRLIRSFDQIPTHQYQGYSLVMSGKVGEVAREFRIAIGPKAHEKHRFRIGDVVAGEGEPVSDPNTEWGEFYKISGLKVHKQGACGDDAPPGPGGGIAPALEVYRANGHRRLDRDTWAKDCAACPWGLNMVTEIIVDHWNPDRKKYRFETHCYGPKDCPRYKPGKPYRVPGRSPGLVYVDDDVERAAENRDETE